MPLTDAEFDAACVAICPLCREQVALRYREATKEWVHDANNKHGICWASGLRKERDKFTAGEQSANGEKTDGA